VGLLRDQEPSGILPVLCGKDDKWKTGLEELLRPNQVVVLLSIGDVKYDVLSYLNAHPNIQIIEMSTRYIKRGDKVLTAYSTNQPYTFSRKPLIKVENPVGAES
jgi:hypothetical protein